MRKNLWLFVRSLFKLLCFRVLCHHAVGFAVVAILLVCGVVAAVVGSRGSAKSFSGATTQVALEKRAIVKVRADNFPACYLFSNSGCRNGFTTLNAQPVRVTLELVVLLDGAHWFFCWLQSTQIACTSAAP